MRTPLSLLLVPTLLVLAGCSTTAYQKAQTAGEEMTGTRESLIKLKDSLDRTAKSLRAVIDKDNGDATQLFREFSVNVTELQQAHRQAIASEETMHSQAGAYFRQWEKEIALIKNADLKTISNDRLVLVRRDYESIRQNLWKARQAYTPLVQEFVDIQRFLSVDLRSAAIRKAMPTADRAIDRTENVKEIIRAALDSINRGAVFSERVHK